MAATKDKPKSAAQQKREVDQAERDKCKRLRQQWAHLKTKRSNRDGIVRDIARVMLPRSTRFFVTDRDRAGSQHHEVYDSTGMIAVQEAASGLITSAMPQSAPFYKLEDAAPELNDQKDVQLWYEEATTITHEIIRRSNLYSLLPETCKEDVAIGQACVLMDRDYDDVVRFQHVTFGEYCIERDTKGKPCVMFREFDMTAAQCVEEFGEEKCSASVRELFKNNPYGWVTVLHAVQPRAHYDPDSRDNREKKYESCYVEQGGNDAGVLRESGFDFFPVLAPKWGGNETYGTGPGDDALPFVLSLQLLELDAAEIANKLARPPLRKGPALKNREVEADAGGETWDDGDENNVTPIYIPHVNAVAVLNTKQQDYRQQVRSALHADKFMMLGDAVQQSGAKQFNQLLVGELRDEKFTVLGPFTENLNGGLIAPMVEGVLHLAMEAGALPPMPPQLSGSYKITFVSKLAQVMRANGLSSTAQYVADLSMVAEMQTKLAGAPVLDKFDADEWADETARRRGVSPKINRSTDEVAGVRQARAEQQKAVAQIQAGNLQADTANKLAGAKTSEPSALTALAGGGA